MEYINNIPPYFLIVIAALFSPRFEKSTFDKIVYFTFAICGLLIFLTPETSKFFVTLEGHKTNIFHTNFYTKIYAIIAMFAYVFYSRLVEFSRRQREVLLIGLASFQAIIFSDNIAGILIFSEILILATLASVIFNKSRGGIQISIFSALICSLGFLLVLSTISISHGSGVDFVSVYNLASAIETKGFESIPFAASLYPFLFILIYFSYLIFEISVYDNSLKRQRIACFKAVLVGSLLVFFYIKFFPASRYLFDIFAIISLYLLFYSSFGNYEKRPIYLLSALIFISLTISAFSAKHHAELLTTYIFLTSIILLFLSNFASELQKLTKILIFIAILLLWIIQGLLFKEFFMFYYQNSFEKFVIICVLYLIYILTWARNFYLAGTPDETKLEVKDILLFVIDIFYHLSVSISAVIVLISSFYREQKDSSRRVIVDILDNNFHSLGRFSRTWKISDTVLYIITLLGTFLFVYYIF